MNISSKTTGAIGRSPLLFLCLILIALLLAVPGVLAQNDDPPPDETDRREVTDDEVNAVADDLYCPSCENIPLDVCGTAACADWRDEIRSMLAEGQTPDQIKAAFAERYGQRVLATPQAEGFDLLVWVLPIVAAAIGLIVLVVTLTRMRPRKAGVSASGPALTLDYDDLDPDLLSRVERDLNDMRA